MRQGSERSGRTVGVGVFAAGLLAGITVAAFGVAGAQTTELPTGVPVAVADDSAAAHPRMKMRHGGIHGEFTAVNPEGGYLRIATQRGEVTEVSASSVTVKSVDGFTRTYAVDADTKINGGSGTIADITKGETVHVAGIIDGDTVRAQRIGDGSMREARKQGMKERRERWKIGQEEGSTPTPPTASGTSA